MNTDHKQYEIAFIMIKRNHISFYLSKTKTNKKKGLFSDLYVDTRGREKEQDDEQHIFA